MQFSDLLGWLGLILLLLAYFLLSINKVKSNSLGYHLINFFGAFFIVIHAYMIKSYPIMVLNLFWGIISVGEIAKLHKKR